MPRYEIINPELFPSEYLGFVDPDDFYSYSGIITHEGDMRQYKSIDELVSHIVARREAAKLPPLALPRETVEHYLYILGEAPRHFFNVISDRTFLADVHKGATIAVSLSRAAISGIFTAGSFGWVTKKEANRRAAICAQCPNNLAQKKSVTTRFNDKVAGLFTTSRTTDHDSKLKDCNVCGCPLAVKVHYSDEIIANNTDNDIEEFPKLVPMPNRGKATCWIRDILANKDGEGK